MNFLAHLYLSGDNKQLMIGNFIADHITGNKFKHFSPEIKKGIFLHRKIDSFTDNHKIFKISKRRLHERYGHYDGIIIDIFYDYFLAKNWNDYSKIKLKNYTQDFYNLLLENKEILPEKTKKILPSLIKYNWLYNYQFLDGIKEVLKSMDRRTKSKSNMYLAIDDLKELESELAIDFKFFFKDLISYSNKQIKK